MAVGTVKFPFRLQKASLAGDRDPLKLPCRVRRGEPASLTRPSTAAVQTPPAPLPPPPRVRAHLRGTPAIPQPGGPHRRRVPALAAASAGNPPGSPGPAVPAAQRGCRRGWARPALPACTGLRHRPAPAAAAPARGHGQDAAPNLLLLGSLNGHSPSSELPQKLNGSCFENVSLETCRLLTHTV